MPPRPSDKPPAKQILATFDSLERRFASEDFAALRSSMRSPTRRGRPSVRKVAVAFKESLRLWFRDLLVQLGVTDAEGARDPIALLVDGSIAQDLVRNDPAMARAAKEAARLI